MQNYELLLLKLDTFIRKYYLNKLLRGVLLFLGLLFGFYLFISLFEYQLYFSSFVRKTLLVLFAGTILTTLFYWIIKPLFHYLRIGKQLTYEQAATIIGQDRKSVV